MKSTDRILAQRYARAFDALSQNALQAQEHFVALCTAEKALQQARLFMADPAVPSVQKTAFVEDLFQDDPAVKGFICVLLQAKRYYLLPACVQEAGALLDQRQGIVRAKVQTAFALTEEQKQRVQTALSRFSGLQAQAEYEVDPALLGGVRAQMGDVLIDGTLKRRFEKLREELTK